jgi:hypothetical protein
MCTVWIVRRKRREFLFYSSKFWTLLHITAIEILDREHPNNTLLADFLFPEGKLHLSL